MTHPFHAADVDVDADRAKSLVDAGEDPDEIVVAVFPRRMPPAEVTRRLRQHLDHGVT